MKRRALLKTTAAGSGVLMVPSLLRAASDLKEKPNILFIMTDQQHDRMMSCADNEWLKTPHLDGLAAEGVRFASAYSANPVCVPSRVSMATGMMPGRLGGGDNKTASKAKLAPHIDENSMGKIMKRAGYDTFYGGKVHMCGQLRPDSDHGAGYDEYFKDQRGLLPGACLKFIRKEREKPFFAVASFINPHDICYAHKAHATGKSPVKNLYDEAMAMPLDELPPLPDNYGIQEGEPSGIQAKLSTTAVTPSMTMRNEYDERAWRVNRYIYHRLTERVDGEIGKILDGLKQAGLEENTLVIFTSDHGNMDASHRLASKSFPYEESVRVPFIMKYKGGIPYGQVDGEHLVSTGLDILPTICDYADVEIPEHLIGKSLRPVAEGKPVVDWREYVVSEDAKWRMLRSKNYKYTTFSDPASKESLVDLKKDPGEMRNLVDNPEYKDILRDHRKLLAEWCASTGDTEAFKFARNDDGSSDYTPPPEAEAPAKKADKRKRKSKKGKA
jgi:arylsulfatase A-like enzyme